MPVTTSFAQLRELLDQHFNEEELRTLCFDVGVDYDSLGGRGKAANARELIELLQRQRLLPELLRVLHQQRPAVNWPDLSMLPDLTAANARQNQARQLFNQVKPLLFPHVWGRDERQALLTEAFYPAHLWILEQIDVDGRPADFLPHCWRTLSQGAPDGSLNTRLLLTVRSRYGDNEQKEIDDIIIAWQQLCAAIMVEQTTAVAGLPERRPLTDAAGRPTLFLSYSARDVAVAERLRTELAAYGHACQIARAPKTDNNAWLAATATGLGSAYAVLYLVGEQTVDDRWQRLEYLAAADRQKPIIPLHLSPAAARPAYVAQTLLTLDVDGPVESDLKALLHRLPPSPPPGRRSWVDEAETLRPRLAELLYMDRLKLAELQHVAQYTRLSGQSAVQRTGSGRLRLNPVVARQEFRHAPWRQDDEPVVEQRRFEDAVAELKTIGRAVLLGDPGSGKTTTFYKLAADLIETALADPKAPVPLMVRLGLWTDEAESFAAFLHRNVGELDEGLEQHLIDKRVALLLDGINEIPANQQAAKYKQVRDFVAQYRHLPAWVSCREQDYPPERDLRLDRVTVAPLDAVRVQAFIHNYLDGRPDFGADAADDLFWQLAGQEARETHQRYAAALGPKLAEPDYTFWLDGQLPDGLEWGYKNWSWEGWLKERAHPASLLLLATNPYMLYMLLEVYQDKRVVPANRGQLFDWFVERLLLRERLFTWDAAAETVVRHPAGETLLAGLTELAYEMQRRPASERRDAGALTALPLDDVTGFLDERQRYQAASANLLSLGVEVRFTHQLLQEYFVARAMRARIFPGSAGGAPTLPATTIWSPERWWEPTNWEEATILLAGLYSNDCTEVLNWVAAAQPELAARCVVESGAHTPEETRLRLRELWLPRLTDLRRDPDARARAAVGRAVGRIMLADGMLLDNRRGVGFVLRDGVKIPDIAWGEEVPAGNYTIGGDKEAYDSFDKRPIEIYHPYRLARYPITNIQFDCFATAPDFVERRWWRGLPEEEQQIRDPYFPHTNSPRETVSWYQAIAFCRWLSDKLGYAVELPHEYEWEVAARYPDGRSYPWGNKFDPAKANTDRDVGQTTAVGLYLHGINPSLKLYDLSGNVWEWCRNKGEEPDDEQIDESVDGRVLRGGSWSNLRYFARAAYRSYNSPDVRNYDGGFRVVVVGRPPISS